MRKSLKLGTIVFLANERKHFILHSKDGLEDNIYTFINNKNKKVSYIYNITDESDYPNIKIKQNPNIKTLESLISAYSNYKIEAVSSELIPVSFKQYLKLELY